MGKKQVPKKIINQEDYSPIEKNKNIKGYLLLLGLVVITILGTFIIINI